MTLRFKLDENLPGDAKALFEQAGHEAHTVLDESLGGAGDPLVSSAACVEERILVTLDLDFADIRAYPPAEHPGIWVLRPPNQAVASILNAISGALNLAKSEPPQHRLWIVELNRVRIRG